MIGFFLFEIGVTANLLAGNNAFVNIPVSVVVHILFARICYKIPMHTSIFYGAILMALSLALEFVMIFFVSAIMKSQPLDYASDTLLFILECPASKLLYFMIVLWLAKIMKPNQRSGPPISMFLYPVTTLINLLVLFYLCVKEHITSEGQYLAAVSCMVMFIVTTLIVLSHQHQTEKDLEHLRIESEYKRLKTEKNYYDILDQQNQALRIYAHDAKNHLAAIQNLNADPRIGEYVAALSGQLENYAKRYRSGNMLLDVILSKYLMECRRFGVSFDCNVTLYNLSDMADMDLVAVLGNLMDNALEAAQKSAEKKVYLETSRRNGYGVVILQNSSLPPEEHSGRLVTSKADSASHGFGLKSVVKTLKKYQGDLQWDYDPDTAMFTTTMMVGNPTGKS